MLRNAPRGVAVVQALKGNPGPVLGGRRCFSHVFLNMRHLLRIRLVFAENRPGAFSPGAGFTSVYYGMLVTTRAIGYCRYRSSSFSLGSRLLQSTGHVQY